MSSYAEQSLAAGIPVFQRTKALELCLESLNEPVIDRVIVADNGHIDKRATLYERDWEFELTVLELDYDSGIGACRAAIAEELTEDYLVVADNDMIIPPTSELKHLQKVLDYDPNLGAVSGIIVEQNRIRSGCSNIHEETSLFGNKFLVHAIRSEPAVEWVEPTLPIARFDKLTNAAMIRKECIEDYSWDSQFLKGEHLDFYLGHYHQTDWEFAACPAVIFDHQKGRYPKYRTEIRKSGENYKMKNETVERLYEQKWGYKSIEYGGRVDWIDSTQKPILEELYRLINRKVSIMCILPVKKIVETVINRHMGK